MVKLKVISGEHLERFSINSKLLTYKDSTKMTVLMRTVCVCVCLSHSLSAPPLASSLL
jgi:hypothetical protein